MRAHLQAPKRARTTTDGRQGLVKKHGGEKEVTSATRNNLQSINFVFRFSIRKSKSDKVDL
jgi:hypothetical protein